MDYFWNLEFELVGVCSGKHHQWFPEASLIMVIYVSMQPLWFPEASLVMVIYVSMQPLWFPEASLGMVIYVSMQPLWFPEASLVLVIYVSMQPLCPPSKRQSMQQEQTPLSCSVQPVPLIFTHDLEKIRLNFFKYILIFF